MAGGFNFPLFVYMATIIDICNAAFSQLGHASNISSIDPPDGSVDADLCNIYYPQALKYLLEQHAWGFAQKRKQLVTFRSVESIYPWEYAYAVPSDCLKITRLDKEGFSPEEPPEDFDLDYQGDNDASIILCNVENPVLTYTCYVNNAEKFPGYFTQALVMQLASFLAGPKLKSAQAKAYIDMASLALSNAKTLDCKNTRRFKLPMRVPSMIKARWV